MMTFMEMLIKFTKCLNSNHQNNRNTLLNYESKGVKHVNYIS